MRVPEKVIRKCVVLAAALLLACGADGLAQDVRSGFLVDSVRIGDEIPFYVSARYPEKLTALFPDSTYDFAPFEYVRRTYYPTRTADSVSVDSAVYYLTTFEIDRQQTLRIPVFIIDRGDSTIFHSHPDTVLITQLVARVPDTVSVQELPLRARTDYEEVNYAFNVWMMVLIGAVVVVLLVTCWLLFGKRIVRWIRLRRLQRGHAGFLASYNALLRQLRQSFSVPLTESALVAWKRYMEQLESIPYTKLTTRETINVAGDASLREDLSRIDGAIYGHQASVVESLENLRAYADARFQRRMKEVQHG